MMNRNFVTVAFIAITWLLLVSIAHGQHLPGNGSSVKKGELIIQPFEWKDKRAELRWEMKPGKEKWRMPFRFNQLGNIYYIERHGPKGTDAFGIGPECIEELRKEGDLIELSPEINLSEPYFIRLIGNRQFTVEPYNETLEIKYLFTTANDVFQLRVLPIFRKQKQIELSYGEFTVSVRLMFPMRDFMKWKE